MQNYLRNNFIFIDLEKVQVKLLETGIKHQVIYE
jgi:hypothetical protein